MLTILIIISLYIILKIIAKIIEERRCIDEKTIRKYMSNRLSEYERNKATAHLGLCETCQKKLHDYNFGSEIEDHLINREE